MSNTASKQSTNLPEITIKAIAVALFTTIILTAANAYLGLRVGMTISASIPAAVISMAILRNFKNSNILENNIVQTAASAGEALTAGIAFTLPALVILGSMHHFQYWPIVFISAISGILGVLFIVPLRRILINDKMLKFPEGTAIAYVLKASENVKGVLGNLVWGGVVSAIISLCQTGFGVIANGLQYWFASGGYVYGFGLGFSPAMLAAGYIVGFEVSISIILGIVIGWVVGIPIISHAYHLGVTQNATATATFIWDHYVRYIGVGTMIVGGVWGVVTLIKPLIGAVKESFVLSRQKTNDHSKLPREERDIPFNYIICGLIIVFILLYFLFRHFIQIEFTAHSHISVLFSISACIWVLLAGFVLAAICAYFAGLVGSSVNPLSGLALAAVLGTSLLLLGLFHWLNGGVINQLEAASLAIVITSVMSAAAAIANDTIQDLKTGQLVGATPWKQQVMLIFGVLVASLIIPYVLQLLYEAYGFVGAMPRPGMDPMQALSAPQAGLIATVTLALFKHSLQWTMIFVGIAVGVGTLIINHFSKKRGVHVPALAVGLGIYLPLPASVPIALGGLASAFVNRKLNKQLGPDASIEDINRHKQPGLMLACGMVAGSSLVGVILAIPFVIYSSTSILNIAPKGFEPIAEAIALIMCALLYLWVRRVVCSNK